MHFFATLYRVGINPCIDVPSSISSQLQKKPGYIPVRGTVNGFEFSANLVPVKNGLYKLYINLAMRKGSRAEVDDIVEVSLTYDSSYRVIPMPQALGIAIKENKTAERVWSLLPQARQKDIKLYLNNLKTEESVRRNIEKLLTKWGTRI